MFPLAKEAVKTLANFRSKVMAGLDRLKSPSPARTGRGHDDGIGGNILVIKFRGANGASVDAEFCSYSYA
jgi:hypothetical protein